MTNPIEKTFEYVERGHFKLARFCLWFFPKAWRFQNRIPISVRFSAAFLGLAVMLVYGAWQTGGWTLLSLKTPKIEQKDYLAIATAASTAQQQAKAAKGPDAPPASKLQQVSSAFEMYEAEEIEDGETLEEASKKADAASRRREAEKAAEKAAEEKRKEEEARKIVLPIVVRWSGCAPALTNGFAVTTNSQHTVKPECAPEEKLLTFKPREGFVLAGVFVNGEELVEAPLWQEGEFKFDVASCDPGTVEVEVHFLAPEIVPLSEMWDWWRKKSEKGLGRRARFTLDGPCHYVLSADLTPDLERYLVVSGHLSDAAFVTKAACIGVALCLLAALLAFVKRRFALVAMQIVLGWYCAAAFLTMRWCLLFGAILNGADHKAYPVAVRDESWTGIFLLFTLVVMYLAPIVVAMLTRCVRNYYRSDIARDVGGEIIVGFKTGGKDPRFRTSMYYALIITWLVLFLPYLLIWFGWEEGYKLPKGGGEMAVQQQVQVKKMKKKKQKKKKLTVNPWSPYILERMNIDEVKTLEELNEETKDVYVATANKRAGGKGKGTGGWPQGMEDSVIRFIRLEYKGGDWNQDMGKGADYNLLIKFHEWTGMKIARETEHRKIERLKYFPKKQSPPFVFLTGMGNISISAGEAKILREYCEKEHGLLFIDNGGGHFDSSVRRMLQQVFPGKGLVDIPNDDSIYQQPFVFPDGAPPFWHHAGYRAMGIRNEGRWMVFYHPGDINDAWKDDHSGASAEVADQAYKLGVNVMFYAFSKYYRHHYDQDKDVDD